MKWEKVSLAELCSVKTGKYDVNHAVENGIYPFYTCALQPFKANTYSFDDELIMLPGNGANVGEVMYYKGKIEAYQRTYVLHSFKANVKYVYFFLKSVWRRTLQNQQYGSATNYIRLNNITDLLVPLPPLHIQEQIADTLDKADALRRKDQELLQKYDELAQAIFYDMFGDPVRNEGGWEYRPLSELAEIIMGQSPPGDTYNSEGLGFPLLNGPTEFGELNPTEKQWTTSPTKFCKKNDILFCVRGATAGKLNIADKEYCIGRGLASIRPKTDALSSYLFLYLSNMYDVFQKTSDGSTFINISGDRLKSLNIPLLPEDDLAKFQKMSEKLQENVSVAKKSAGKGIIFFDSIMNYYFP